MNTIENIHLFKIVLPPLDDHKAQNELVFGIKTNIGYRLYLWSFWTFCDQFDSPNKNLCLPRHQKITQILFKS